MLIKYLGHSAFFIKGEKFSVVTDPFSDIGYDMQKTTADFCISSHNHYDHAAFSKVSATIVDEKNQLFTAIPTFHDNSRGALRGSNTVYKFELDGLTLCHLGDLGQDATEQIINKIGSCDILFIPVGGNYTIGYEQAIKYAFAIDCKVIIPMHYKTKRCNIDIDDNGKFLSAFKLIEIKPNPFEIDKSNLPPQKTVFLPRFE